MEKERSEDDFDAEVARISEEVVHKFRAEVFKQCEGKGSDMILAVMASVGVEFLSKTLAVILTHGEEMHALASQQLMQKVIDFSYEHSDQMKKFDITNPNQKFWIN